MEDIELTGAIVRQILEYNKMEGRVEVGYRFWISEFITSNHVLNKDKEAKIIRDIIHNDLEIPVHGFFETDQQRNSHITTCVSHIMGAYRKFKNKE